MRILYILFVFASLSIFASCRDGNSHQRELPPQTAPPPSTPTPAPAPDTLVARLSAVGDLLVHRWQMTKAYNKKDSTFDFSCAFELVKPHFDKADLLAGNLETTFAGRGKGRGKATLGYSCFPCFNAPEAFAEELKSVGFDLLSTANNHSLDSRLSGLRSTLHLLDSLGIKSVGTATAGEQHGRLQLMEVNGIKIGFCAYTSSLNGFRLADSLKYSVNMVRHLDSANCEQMKRDVSLLKSQGADAIAALVHFGTEYQRNPNAQQRKMVDSLFAYGVDIIFGSHPHILQRMEVRTITNPDSTRRKGVAFYSLGNFISSQQWKESHNLSKDLGVIAEVELQKVDGHTQVKSIICKPTYTFWRRNCIGVAPVLDVLADSLLYKGMRTYDKKRLRYAEEHVPQFLFAGDQPYRRTDDGYRVEVE